MPAKVLVLGLDAAEATLIERWAAAGQLATFADLARRGAVFRLDNPLDTLPEAIWHELHTGRDAGKTLNEIYRETYDHLKPDFGDLVIFDHCLPFDVSRAYDEAGGTTDPRIWTAERDTEMWQAVEGS